MAHTLTVEAAREIGGRWEREFCRLAIAHGKSLTPTQLEMPKQAVSWYGPKGTGVVRYLLPDVVVWTAPGEHHEIKHKNPTGSGCYGLERYRFEPLLRFQEETNQAVLYTIHDWELAGAKNSRDPMPNRLEDWRTCEIRTLCANLPKPTRMPTLRNGTYTNAEGYYWRTSLWSPLAEWWYS